MKYLLTGIPGTGKSTIGKILEYYGFKFVDSDDEPNLAGWVNSKTGERADRVLNADAQWYEDHSWNLDLVKLKSILAHYSNGPESIVVCGMATNLVDSFELYDRVILLVGDYSIIEQRLLSRSDDPDPESIKAIFSWAKSFEENAKNAGAITVDASASAEQVAMQVMSQLN